MANQPTHRCILAAPETTTMDPTHKKNQKPTPFSSTTASAKPHHPHLPAHPLPDPTITPPSTIQTISHRFSKLYANHKRQVASNSSKPSSNGGALPYLSPHPQPDIDLQAKIFAPSPVSNTSCTTLTKSSSQQERKSGIIDLGVAEEIIKLKDPNFTPKTIKVKGKDEIKKVKKDPSKKPSFEECDLKKASQLMSKSLENVQVKKFQQGVIEGMRRTSVSSMLPPMVSGDRRKSFCSSQIELADFFSCNGVKVVAVDMPPFMQIHAVDCARKTHDSMEKFTSKTLALTLKKEFDGVYGPAWHCIVGTSFGSFVTHSVGGFMYFSLDHKIYILLFKTTVQRAE